VHHLLEEHAQRLRSGVREVEPAAMDVLLKYSWPGNIRELRNVLERAVVLAEGSRLTAADLPESVRSPGALQGSPAVGDDLSVKRQTDRLERYLIQKALERTGGNRTQAAELLELSPRALRYKMLDFGLR
jgi:two-component system response regulator AtoC